MVRRLLQLPGLPGTDAADGLGMAITHAHAGSAMGRLGEAATLNRRHAMRLPQRMGGVIELPLRPRHCTERGHAAQTGHE